MNKLAIAAAGGAVLGLVVTTQVAGPLIAQEAEGDRSIYEQLDLFGDIFERIRADYVEAADEGELMEAAINGMLTSLDPHSSYLSPEDAAKMRVQTQGEFGGLGLEVTQEEGWVKVVSPMDGTPADVAGIVDRRLHHGGGRPEPHGPHARRGVEMMRGPVGSEIVLTIAREARPEPFDVSDHPRHHPPDRRACPHGRGDGGAARHHLQRADLPQPERRAGRAGEAAGGIENVNGVVLDLRNNPGGPPQPGDLRGGRLPRCGRDRVHARPPPRGRRAVQRHARRPERRAAHGLLINGGSASASEIVAGALQDHDRAVVVGTQSFGKGSVQTVMPLPGGGAMRLTTARYFTPSGRSIQALGISPDIIVQQPPRPDPERARPRRRAAPRTASSTKATFAAHWATTRSPTTSGARSRRTRPAPRPRRRCARRTTSSPMPSTS
jgi:carboxyl-terminal processing protease